DRVANDAHRGRERRDRRLNAAHEDFSLHARLTVSGQRAEVSELTPLVGAKYGHAAGAFTVDPIGARLEFGEYHVVLDTVVVHEADLHDVTLVDPQRRIDDTLDGTADADERHLSLGKLGAWSVAHGRRVLGRRALLRDRRLRGRLRERRWPRLGCMLVT